MKATLTFRSTIERAGLALVVDCPPEPQAHAAAHPARSVHASCPREGTDRTFAHVFDLVRKSSIGAASLSRAWPPGWGAPGGALSSSLRPRSNREFGSTRSRDRPTVHRLGGGSPVASTLVFEPVDRDPHRIEPVDGEREAEECGANGVPARHPVDKPRPGRRQRHGPWRAPGEHTILPGAVEHVRATAVERAAKEGPTRAEREREVTNVCPVGATRKRKPAASERALLAWRMRHGGRRARGRLWRCVGGRRLDRTSASSERRKLECAPKEPRRMKR
jgi:hypothetical protein